MNVIAIYRLDSLFSSVCDKKKGDKRTDETAWPTTSKVSFLRVVRWRCDFIIYIILFLFCCSMCMTHKLYGLATTWARTFKRLTEINVITQVLAHWTLAFSCSFTKCATRHLFAFIYQLLAQCTLFCLYFYSHYDFYRLKFYSYNRKDLFFFFAIERGILSFILLHWPMNLRFLKWDAFQNEFCIWSHTKEKKRVYGI